MQNIPKTDLNKIKGEIIILIEKFKSDIKNIDPGFKNFIVKSENLDAKIHGLAQTVWLFVNLHKDEEKRELGRKVDLEINEVIRKFSYDEEVYSVFKKYYKTNFSKEKKQKLLTEEEIKIVEDYQKSYKKMGMDLPLAKKKQILAIGKKINKLCSDFEKVSTKIYDNGAYFSKEELKGVKDNFLENLDYDEKKDKYFVNIRPTVIGDVLKYCVVEETRKKISQISGFGAGDKNTKRFAEILKLREKLIKILGFKNFAEYGVSDEMMSNPSDIKKFLENLFKQINPIFKNDIRKDFEILKDWQGSNYSDKTKIAKRMNSWSWSFAENLRLEKELGVTEEDYKPFFELEKSIEVIFKIWEDIFDVKTEVQKGEHVFDDSDIVYKFINKTTGELLSMGVFDLFPRKGKYGHACINDIFVNHVDEDGKKNKSLIYLICNFMKNKNGSTLLNFSDVVTLYHEAGHFINFILHKSNYASTYKVSNDFVEIPSQFHENFLFDERFVKSNFKHFETGEDMPKRLLSKIHELNKKGGAGLWVIQTMYSLFDQELHGKNISKYNNNYKNIDNLFETLYRKMINVETVKERHFASRFTHLTHGYQSRYYSYVLSRVYAQDFWNEFSKKGIHKNSVSIKYKKLLEETGSKDGKVLVKEFLGRKVSLKPFLDTLKN